MLLQRLGKPGGLGVCFEVADECVSGPCNGSVLEVLEVVETKGTVYLSDPRYVVLCRESKADG